MIETSFILLSVAVAGLVCYCVRSLWVTVGVVGWMALTAALASAGLLRNFSALPPAAPLVFGSGFVATVLLARSRAVAPLLELSPQFLVGFQSFRILVEILIHKAADQGIAPPQMSWSGMNFDIVTGVTALLLMPFAHRLPRSVLLAWNTMGLGLLAWVVGVAVVSFPTRFQVLKPSNTWIAEFPYVWLPAVLVAAALLMHWALYRKMSGSHRSE
jgi:hypothetical protein